MKGMKKMNKKETITGLSKQTEPILIYLISLLGLIFSFLQDEVDKEARWVYNQAGAIFIVHAGIGAIAGTAIYIPVVGAVVGISCWMLSVAVLVFAIIAIVKAYNDEHYEIPLISNIAKAIWKWEEPTKKTSKVKEVEVKKETKKSAKKED